MSVDELNCYPNYYSWNSINLKWIQIHLQYLWGSRYFKSFVLFLGKTVHYWNMHLKWENWCDVFEFYVREFCLDIMLYILVAHNTYEALQNRSKSPNKIWENYIEYCIQTYLFRRFQIQVLAHEVQTNLRNESIKSRIEILFNLERTELRQYSTCLWIISIMLTDEIYLHRSGETQRVRAKISRTLSLLNKNASDRSF